MKNSSVKLFLFNFNLNTLSLLKSEKKPLTIFVKKLHHSDLQKFLFAGLSYDTGLFYDIKHWYSLNVPLWKLAFPQNFLTWKLGKITVFYPVWVIKLDQEKNHLNNMASRTTKYMKKVKNRETYDIHIYIPSKTVCNFWTDKLFFRRNNRIWRRGLVCKLSRGLVCKSSTGLSWIENYKLK